MKIKTKIKSVNSDLEFKVKITFDDKDKIFSSSAKGLMPRPLLMESMNLNEIPSGRYSIKIPNKNIPNFEIVVYPACGDHPWRWQLV